jgi:2-dehydro-3-deoxyphosphogluconate aldolase/(4S)-4-hydroxy-2-oxoglutarate aldolase
MKTKDEIIDSIVQQGVLPLFFYPDPEVSVNVILALYKAGVRVMEYTNRAEAAFENFKALKQIQLAEMPDLLLGVGTIKTAQQASDFAAIGADFFVSPIVDSGVASVAESKGLVWIPGCMTPTEIHTAQLLGAKLIKLFPANILGPGFVSAVKELFPGLMMMPTGGVEMEINNIKSWFSSGVSAVGMGSKLITKTILANKEYDQLYSETLRVLQMIQTAR